MNIKRYLKSALLLLTAEQLETPQAPITIQILCKSGQGNILPFLLFFAG